MNSYTDGQVIEVSGYPFVRTVFNGSEWDGERLVEYQSEGWRPGCDTDRDYPFGSINYFADATGEMILTVVSVHKPGRFPDRVFYTRQWRDPDGKAFGDNKKLRVMSSASFAKLCRGYRHSFEVVE